MNTSDKRSPSRFVFATALLASALLAACGGGGDAMGGDDGADQAAQSAAADTATTTQAPQESAESTQAALQTTQGLVVRGNAGVTIACPGGGTARYELSGGFDDRLLAAGEVYHVHFDQCRGAFGAVALSGDETVTITTVNANRIDATLAFDNLVAQTPLARDTLTGSATLSTGFAYANDGSLNDGTITTRLVADRISVARHTALRDTSYTLSAVDISRTVTIVGGVVTATTVDGTATVGATWPGGSFSATFETDGSVTFVGGLPVAGQWKVIGPRNTLYVSATLTTITIGLDLGSNGTIDLSLTFRTDDWSGQAL